MEIIFDFDGTIADTFDAGVKIINRLANRYEVPEMSPEDVKIVRDQGIKAGMLTMRKNGASWIKLIKIGRKIQKELNKEISRIKMFKGIKQVLEELKKDGYVLGILSTNTKKNINDFLRVNKLSRLFDYVETCGVIWGKTRRFKRILKRRELSPAEVVYVGDEFKDIATCKKLKVKIIVVTWGFNPKRILEGYNPEWLVNKPDGILNAIGKLKKKL